MNNRHRTIERIKRSESYNFGISVNIERTIANIKHTIEETVKKAKYDWVTDLETTKKELFDRLYDTLPKKPVRITINLDKKRSRFICKDLDGIQMTKRNMDTNMSNFTNS